MRNALFQFQDQVQNKVVSLRTDNTTVLCYLKKQGGLHNKQLNAIAIKICLWAHNRNVILCPSYIATNLNVLADRLSRLDTPVSSEWSLSIQSFQWVVRRSFLLEVNLMATRWNHKVPLFVSPCPDNRAIAVNVLETDWNQFQSAFCSLRQIFFQNYYQR